MWAKCWDEGSFHGTDGREKGVLPKSLLCYCAQDTLTTSHCRVAGQGKGGTVRPYPWDTQQCLCLRDVCDVPGLVLALEFSPLGASLLSTEPAVAQLSPGSPCARQVQRVRGQGGDCHDAEAERQRAERGPSSQGSEQISQVHLDRYQGCAPRGVWGQGPSHTTALWEHSGVNGK